MRRFLAGLYLERAHRRTAGRRFLAGLYLEGAHRSTAVRRPIFPLAHHYNGGLCVITYLVHHQQRLCPRLSQTTFDESALFTH